MYGTVDWATATDAPTLGSSWKQVGSGIGIAGGFAMPLDTSAALARWATPYSSDDGWAELTIGTIPTTDYEIGPIIHSTANDPESGGGYYHLRFRSSSGSLQLMRKGDATTSLTGIASYAYTLQENDTLRIEIEGTTLRGILNGTIIMTATDSVLAPSSTTRYGGVRAKGSLDTKIASFSIGDLGASEPAPGGDTPTSSSVVNHTWQRWDGTTAIDLEMLGVWDGSAIQIKTLELLGTYVPPAPAGGTGTPPTLNFTPLRTVNVTTATELYAAIDGAQQGDLISMADGTYLMDATQADCVADGTESLPIALYGSRNAIITTGDPNNGHYGLHASGDYWQFLGFRITAAKKGFVMDGAKFAYIDGIEVDNVGQEAVHFRTASSDGIIKNSDLHDTGLSSPSFAEGVYVGSATSNWSTQYNGVYYGENNGTGPDRSDRCQILNNHMWNVRAEGVDAKEGTVDGLIQGNLFEACGWSGANSADSAVDAKGNNWTIAQNTISPLLPNGDVPGDATTPTSSFLDALQTHVISTGYGEGNIFIGNTLQGTIPGYFVSISPAPGTHNNIVYDDNYAPGAQSGLSNITITPKG